MLCALIYFGGGIFRLALKSVEILLPQFVQALEMIYTESMKLRFNLEFQINKEFDLLFYHR